MVFDFWNELKQWLQSKCNHLDNVIFSKTDIMLGITTKNKVDLTLNFILLNAKQYIYKCRLDQKPLSMNSYKNWIKTSYDIEKYIAYTNCDWNKFND